MTRGRVLVLGPVENEIGSGMTGGELVIYDHASFTGRSFSARSSIDNLVDKDFNDRAQSLIIYAGRWQLCTDANYAGRCVVFGPGRYENLQDLNNKLSSFKRLP